MGDTVKAVPETSEEAAAHAQQNTISTVRSGVGCTVMLEPVPEFIRAECEYVIKGGPSGDDRTSNSWIVLGRDRPHTRRSGRGGRGEACASMIDIVVGRGSAGLQKSPPTVTALTQADPNFKSDAARIYISQKTNIDENFVLGGVDFADDGDLESTGRSAVGIKADCVRIIGREGIRLITEAPPAQNSRGGNIAMVKGIDLLAGNGYPFDEKGFSTGLQPLVKGDNLVAALRDLAKVTSNLQGIVLSFLKSQMNYNKELATHTHFSPFFWRPYNFISDSR